MEVLCRRSRSFLSVGQRNSSLFNIQSSIAKRGEGWAVGLYVCEAFKLLLSARADNKKKERGGVVV